MFFSLRKIYLTYLPALRKMFCVDLPTLRKMLVVASKIGGQHLTPPEPSAMSKGTTTKARRQAIEIPTFRMVSGL